MKKVSIIVPIYNVEKYLSTCLDSLVNQTFEDIEIICVNDGTKDQSQKIVDNYKDKYPNKIISIIKKNGGLGDARNCGLEAASGEFVVFIDSDDWIELDMIETMYQNAIKNNADIVCCGLRRITEDGKVLSQEQINLNLVYTPTEAIIKLAPAAWNKLYKKELFIDHKIRYPKGLWYEDLPTTTELFMVSNKITTVNKIFINYLQREGSIIYSYDQRARDIFKVLKNIKKYNDDRFNHQYDNEVEYLFIIHIIFAHLFRASVLSVRELNKEIKYSKNILQHNFPNWRNNEYIKLFSHNKMGFVKKMGVFVGTTCFKLNLYLPFLMLYKIVNKLSPIQNKW